MGRSCARCGGCFRVCVVLVGGVVGGGGVGGGTHVRSVSSSLSSAASLASASASDAAASSTTCTWGCSASASASESSSSVVVVVVTGASPLGGGAPAATRARFIVGMGGGVWVRVGGGVARLHGGRKRSAVVAVGRVRGAPIFSKVPKHRPIICCCSRAARERPSGSTHSGHCHPVLSAECSSSSSCCDSHARCSSSSTRAATGSASLAAEEGLREDG